jgi:rsbT antagonist protein RsbS
MDRVPILKLGDILLVSIQVDLEDEIALALQSDLAERIADTGARGVLVDISALEIVDSFIGRVFADIAATSTVLDAETVVVGMRPAVAMTLVDLGLSLGGVRTALNVEKGLKILRRDLGLHGAEGLEGIMADDHRSAGPDRSGPAAGGG